MIPTAEEFLKDNLSNPKKGWSEKRRLIEFAKLHIEYIRSLQKAKWSAGETGYIKREEWEEILNDIK